MTNSLIGPFQITTSGNFNTVVDTRTGLRHSTPTSRLDAIQQAAVLNSSFKRNAVVVK